MFLQCIFKKDSGSQLVTMVMFNLMTKKNVNRTVPYQTQKFLLEVVPIIQLWVPENKTAINISDQKLTGSLAALKTLNSPEFSLVSLKTLKFTKISPKTLKTLNIFSNVSLCHFLYLSLCLYKQNVCLKKRLIK